MRSFKYEENYWDLVRRINATSLILPLSGGNTNSLILP